MEDTSSPLMRLMQNPEFKPFSGPHALRILAKAKQRMNLDQIDETDLLNAVSSLGFLLETEIALIYALQDQICTKCGKCCTDNTMMRLSKEELERIAEVKGVSYKKLKRSTRAQPNKDGTLRIRRHPCPFYKDECTVYASRPSVCRQYPADRVIKALAGQVKYPVECEIVDSLLVEIVVKRTLEEKMSRENPELLREMAERKRQELSRLTGMNQAQRLQYLRNRYQKTLNGSG